MKKAIIIGASSGIGKSLAGILANQDYRVGITGRRAGLLAESEQEHPGKIISSAFDIVNTTESIQALEILVKNLGGLDLLILSSGTGDLNPGLDFNIEKTSIDTNVLGFTNVVDWAYNHFERQGHGHLVIISSVAGLRGGRHAPAYNASKAYQVNYMEGLRQKARHSGGKIVCTDIRPGFVDTAMAKGEGQFWVASADKAAAQIYMAIKKKKNTTYVTRRWRGIAWILKHLPAGLHQRM